MPCLVCKSNRLAAHFSVGAHPVATFFLQGRDDPENPVDLTLVECQDCGTIQLEKPVTHDALKAPYSWIYSREPEDHLDDLVERVTKLCGITQGSCVAGVTYKDDTTLDRFRARGVRNVWRLDLASDFGVEDPGASVETLQKVLTPERVTLVAGRRGKVDLLIVRHVIEHSEGLEAFLLACRELLAPDGHLVVELPDCSTSLNLRDYAMIWEEHSLYFVPETFAQSLQLGGFESVEEIIYPLPFENCIVQIARVADQSAFKATQAALAQRGTLKAYADAFLATTAALREVFVREREAGGKVALFGAGHLACAFVNFHDLADLVEFVADDTPEKQGLFLPGARMSILPSAELVNQNITLCVLCLSIGNEDKILANNPDFLERGGRFVSALRASPRAVLTCHDA